MSKRKSPTRYDVATMKLFEDYTEATKTWGWQEDMDIGKTHTDAKRTYEETRTKLLKRLRQLASSQRKLTKMRHLLKQNKEFIP